MKRYRRVGYILAEPYEDYHTEFLGNGISISSVDYDEIRSSGPHGMIATNPDDPEDKWYVNHKYFKENYEPYEVT